MAVGRLEAMDLNGLGIDFQSLFLVYKKFLHSISLITLKLNHVAGLFIVDDGSVAGKLLFDNLENLLQIELGWNSFDCSQGLATIALLNTNVDVGLCSLLGCFSSILILRIREGIERFKVLDLRGHTTFGG